MTNLKTNMMKKQLLFIIFLFAAFVSNTGCKKTANEITCNLNTTASQPPVGMNIVYTATQTGDGTMAYLSYVTNFGTVTVQNPQLPWTITVPVLSGTFVSMTAVGTTKNGSLKINYEGINGGSTIRGSDYCEQQTN